MSSVLATDRAKLRPINYNAIKPEEQTPGSLLEDFRMIRQTTDHFASRFSTEDQNIQSMADASPLKWHRAHTSWFFETFLLRPHLADYQSPDELYAYLFNSYYNGIGKQYPRSQRSLITRPDAAAVSRYREHVDVSMETLVSTLTEDQLRTIVPLIILGLNHEQQHQELMVTDIKHGLSFNPARPAWATAATRSATTRPLGWIEFAGGLDHCGHAGDGFAFDNERPHHPVFVHPFQLADRPASCGDYMAFMNDGGYSRPELWLSDGWAWCRDNQIKAPLYWWQEDGRWLHYTAYGAAEVDPDSPVCHISFYEAAAFAQWSDARLPLEHEWERAARDFPVDGHFGDQGVFHPAGASGDQPMQQLFGDVWEWTASSYAPYPGFKPAGGAIGEYNGKFMANQMVLRGGSCATAAGHMRASYRNFFYPADRWQFSGIRLARDLA